MSQEQSHPDVYGKALYDYYSQGHAEELILHTSYGETEHMPVDWFFRDEEDFPELERIALGAVRGKTLDIGAGTGSHAIYLYENGIDVWVMDSSAYCVMIMKERGLSQVKHQSVWLADGQRYDTLLMLMNGIGLVGTIDGLIRFLDIAKSYLNPGGCLLFDSSDLSYLYPDHDIMQKPELGEISYQYEYCGQLGEPFTWLYVDFTNLQRLARNAGWKARLLYEDPYAQFLAKLTLL
jgi:hypothetical protein